MAIARENPTSLEAALKLARMILSTREDLVRKNLIETEAEQIVLAAYRRATGELLSRSQLYLRGRDRLPDQAGQEVIVNSMARAQGKILQHLTGTQFFFGHEYEVSPAVLVPRPETEVLLAEAMKEITVASESITLGLEIGAGSGILSIELLAHFPALHMIASELSPEAAGVANKNAESILRKGRSRFQLISVKEENQVLEPFNDMLGARKAGFLISNPPYLGQSDFVEPEVRTQEPAGAVFAPAGDPLFFYRAIAEQARTLLSEGGFVAVELPSERADLIDALFRSNSWQTRLVKDLNGLTRVLIARNGNRDG